MRWTRDAQTISVVTRDRIYHRRLGAESPLRFQNPTDEMLVDPAADPEGRRDLSGSGSDEEKRLVRAAQEYFEVYPWVVVQGRSGLPSLGAKSAPEAAPK